MNRRQPFKGGLLSLGLLWLAGCHPLSAVTLVSAQKVEVPVCVPPAPPRQLPEKPDIPLNHLNEDMEVGEVILAYRQSVVLLEGWGDALYTVLKDGYQASAPFPREASPPQAAQPVP